MQLHEQMQEAWQLADPCTRMVQECYGSKLLVVRHPVTGTISVLDAHCFHQGTALAGGDIEDLDGHACIVCPAHRYRIDLATGCKVDTNLEGHVCSSADQHQRIYRVHNDSEFVWVDLPDVPGPPLPSDYYNQRQPQLAQRTPDRPAPQNYGLRGSAPPPGAAPAAVPPPLQPYAGINGWPVPPAAGQMAESPPLVLSQEPPRSPAPAGPPTRINFPAVKADPPHVARRKAATAAILAKSYRAPTAAPVPVQPIPKPAAPAGHASNAGGSRQATLFEAWGRPVTTAPSDAMDTT